jgi:hypothetical protein
MNTPTPETRQLEAHVNVGMNMSGHLTVARVVTRAIARDWRLLVVVVVLVVGSPILTWWLPLPGAASVSVGVAFGVVASVGGYFAITKVVRETITE